MTSPTYGFVGLGNMGGPMAANLAAGGFAPVVHDKAGTEVRTPEGAVPAASLAELAGVARTVFLSLPDGSATLEVARAIAARDDRTVDTVIDLSTVGVDAAREAQIILAAAGVEYADAPVSGGTAGAKAGTVTIMFAGPAELLERHREALECICGNLFHVGDAAGQGQAMKLLNNFLSGTAMAATSEALAFGETQGLSMAGMLDVLNVSTGANSATADKFPNRVLTGRYDSGFQTALMAKDMGLYIDTVRTASSPDEVGSTIADMWQRMDAALPSSDFTRIYEFVRAAPDG